MIKNSKQFALLGIIVTTISLFVWVNNNHNELILPLTWILVGSGFIFHGISLRKSNRVIEKNGINTKAEIIDYKTSKIGANKTYTPIIKFNNEHGDEITQELKQNDITRRVNCEIDIIYLFKNNEYEIIKGSSLWTIYYPIATFFIGSSIIAAGLFSMI